MDPFSALVPKAVYINTLPQLMLGKIPLTPLVYLMILLLIGLTIFKFNQGVIKKK